MNRHLAAGVAALTIAAAGSTVVAPSFAAEASLCTPGETPVFSCPIGTKLASICTLPGGGAAYRYGRPGHVELQSRDLSTAEQGFSGGGESQISFEHQGYRYVIYSKTVRTGFGADGHNDPQSASGLLVQKDGRTISAKPCGGSGDQPIDARASKLIPAGIYAPH